MTTLIRSYRTFFILIRVLFFFFGKGVGRRNFAFSLCFLLILKLFDILFFLSGYLLIFLTCSCFSLSATKPKSGMAKAQGFPVGQKAVGLGG